MTGLEKDGAARVAGDLRRGRRGPRSVGVQLLGVLLLALGLGLCYAGVVSGLYGPLGNATQGAITVDYCTHHDAKKSNGRKCHGSFAATKGGESASYAVVDTDEAFPKGQKISVVRIGESSYFTSSVDAVASGLRYLFGGMCAIGPAFFCLIAGRWPGPGAANVLRSMNPVFSWLTFPLVGLGLIGVVITSIMAWAM